MEDDFNPQKYQSVAEVCVDRYVNDTWNGLFRFSEVDSSLEAKMQIKTQKLFNAYDISKKAGVGNKWLIEDAGNKGKNKLTDKEKDFITAHMKMYFSKDNDDDE